MGCFDTWCVVCGCTLNGCNVETDCADTNKKIRRCARTAKWTRKVTILSSSTEPRHGFEETGNNGQYENLKTGEHHWVFDYDAPFFALHTVCWDMMSKALNRSVTYEDFRGHQLLSEEGPLASVDYGAASKYWGQYFDVVSFVKKPDDAYLLHNPAGKGSKAKRNATRISAAIVSMKITSTSRSPPSMCQLLRRHIRDNRPDVCRNIASYLGDATNQITDVVDDHGFVSAVYAHFEVASLIEGTTPRVLANVADACPNLSCLWFVAADVTSEDIEKLLVRCREVKHLHFLWMDVDDALVRKIVQYLPQLVSLTIEETTADFSGSGLEKLTCLRILELPDTHLKDEAMVRVSAALTNLETLNLACTELEEETTRAILQANSGLKRLELPNDLSDETLAVVGTSCPRIESLSFSCSEDDGVTDAGVGRLIDALPALKKLDVSFMDDDPRPIPQTVQAIVSSNAPLRSIELSGVDLDTATTNQIKSSCPTLDKLTVESF